MRLKASVSGLDELLSKLWAEPIHARPWRNALRAAINLGVRVAQSRAPKETGKLARTVRGKLARTRVPEWGVVTAGRSRKGFRFGFALDAGHGKRRTGTRYEFHFRGTDRSTQGWFTDTRDVVQSEVNRLLSQAAKEIEASWGH